MVCLYILETHFIYAYISDGAISLGVLQDKNILKTKLMVLTKVLLKKCLLLAHS